MDYEEFTSATHLVTIFKDRYNLDLYDAELILKKYNKDKQLALKLIEKMLGDVFNLDDIKESIMKSPQYLKMDSDYDEYLLEAMFEKLVYVDILKRPDKKIQDLVFTHSVNYSYLDGVEEDISRIRTIIDNFNNPNFQMCCADKKEHLGKTGVYIKGEVLVASNNDIFSDIADNGRRTIPMYFAKKLIRIIEEYESVVSSSYKEMIIVPKEIKGLWIKPNGLDENYINKIESLSNELNVPLTRLGDK